LTSDFRLPDIGEGISEASLIEWMVAVGDQVEEGDDVAVVSTDKADVELASPKRGVVAELCWQPGDLIKVGQVLLKFEGSAAQPVAEQPAASPEKTPAKTPAGKPGVIAAPATRKLAADTGVDLNTLAGTGPGGEITHADVEAASAPQSVADTRTEPLEPLRQAMAARLSQSVRTSVHATIDFQMDGSALAALHRRLAGCEELSGAKISLTAILAKCLAAALARHPRLNATIDEAGQTLTLRDRADLGVALASARGLVVPVLSGANRKPLEQIATELADLTARGRDGKLKPDEMRGGSFTLSNTGSLEQAMIEYTTPIIVPPQTGILWVSRLRDRLWVEEGQAVVRPVLNASLSFDHRCHDGADAMNFINDFSRFVAAPEAALIT
jgi:pyruvate/2-oxoglutarate dehydrogenase complex dihydrolipoamide acyltransferase (E2) component